MSNNMNTLLQSSSDENFEGTADISAESIEEFNRPPREYPEQKVTDFRVAQPPTRSARPQRFNPFTIFAPVIFLSIPAISLLQSSGDNVAIGISIIVLMVVATLSIALGSLWWERRSQRLDEQDQVEAYKMLLEEQTAELGRLLNFEKSVRNSLDPAVPYLLPRVLNRTDKLWERRPTDPDFLSVRLGIGKNVPPINVKLVLPEPSGSPLILSKDSRTLAVRPLSLKGKEQLPEPAAKTLFELARNKLRPYQGLSDVPFTANLPAVGSLGLVDYTLSADLLRAIILQIVTHHSPDEVRIAAVISRRIKPIPAENGRALSQASEWDWLRLLPHTRPLRPDIVEPMVVSTIIADAEAEMRGEDAERLLTALLDELSQREKAASETNGNESKPLPPYLILLLIGDTGVFEHTTIGYVLRRGPTVRASALCLVDKVTYLPGECGAVVNILGIESAQYTHTVPGGAQFSLQLLSNEQGQRLDEASTKQCEVLARSMQHLRPRAHTGAGDLSANVELMDLLKIKLENFDPSSVWFAKRANRFRTILGIEVGNKPREFDLVEHGPHGLIAGTSGSGKSKLLLSLVLGLALTHDPRDLNFVLVDYKGGGDLGVFQMLPHNVGLITNLQGRLAERALNAFTAELRTRQRAFAQVDASDLATYEQRRQDSNPNTPRFARTLIVIDEFAQLAQELPEFMTRLLSIAQIGRSLGIHLLLATQRPAGVVTPGIAANINYRICLRVVSLEESRDVLGRPEAALLPHNRPGRAYFQIGQTTFTLFQTARVDVPYPRLRPLPQGVRRAVPAEQPHAPDPQEHEEGWELPNRDTGLELLMNAQMLRQIRATPIAGVEVPNHEEPLVVDVPPDATVAQVVVAVLRHHALAEHLVPIRGPWSPPLPNTVSLPVVFHSTNIEPFIFRRTVHNKWAWLELPEEEWLRAPIGLIDDIENQCHRPYIVDFYRGGTHLLISGAAGSGKSSVVRAIISSLGLSHDPGSLWCYLVDFSGLTLSSLTALPHVGQYGLFQPNELARIKRLLRWLRTTMEERKRDFGVLYQSNLWSYRRKLRELGKPETTLPAAIIVVIDNFAGFREVFEDELQTLIALARDGKSAGIHLIITADRPSALPAALTSNIELQIALRLNDLTESSAILNKPDAAHISVETPGRGFLRGQTMLEVQFAQMVSAEGDDAQSEALFRLGEQMQQAVDNHALPEPILLLKDNISLSTLYADLDHKPALFTDGLNPIIIGCDDQTLRPTAVDLERDGPHMLVTGSKGSGKSVLMRAWASGLSRRCETSDQLQVALVGFQRSFRLLCRMPGLVENGYVEQPAQLRLLTRWLRQQYDQRREALLEHKDLTTAQLGPSVVVLIDDYDMVFAEAEEEVDQLGEIAKGSRDLGIHFVVASNVEEMSRYYHSLAKTLKAIRAGILLRVNEPGDGLVLGVRLPYDLRVSDIPPGRGYLVTARGQRLIQCATAEQDN